MNAEEYCKTGKNWFKHTTQLMEEYANLKLKESEVSEEEIEEAVDEFNKKEFESFNEDCADGYSFEMGAKWMQSKLNKK